MRKIQTIEEKQKKDTRNKMIIGLVLISLMVLSTAAYAFYYIGEGNENQEKQYNGLVFNNEGGLWTTAISGYEFSFMHTPDETENISINMQLNINDYVGKPLYFVSNHQGVSEIVRNLDSFTLRTQYACYDDFECEESLPIKNCSDNLIIFKEADYTEITQEDNCVFINCQYSEAIRVSDGFLYRILGVR